MDCTELCRELGNPFNLTSECDPAKFLEALFLYNDDLYSIVKLFVDEDEKCPKCNTITPPDESEVLIQYINLQNPPETL